MENAAQAITNLLNAGVDSNPPDAGRPFSPDEALDQAIASAERTGEATSQLLESALQSTQSKDAELTPEQATIKEELDRKLTDLDEQIAAKKKPASPAPARRVTPRNPSEQEVAIP